MKIPLSLERLRFVLIIPGLIVLTLAALNHTVFLAGDRIYSASDHPRFFRLRPLGRFGALVVILKDYQIYIAWKFSY